MIKFDDSVLQKYFFVSSHQIHLNFDCMGTSMVYCRIRNTLLKFEIQTPYSYFRLWGRDSRWLKVNDFDLNDEWMNEWMIFIQFNDLAFGLYIIIIVI